MHFHGTEVGKPIPSYQIYKGTVFELVDQAVDFVMGKINRAVGARTLSNQAPVIYELPRLAVAEAIVNAVAHRDYTSNASVQVMLFSDRLEVWNPGQLPPPLTLKGLRAPHPSIPHNPLIAEPLFLTRYIEKAGTGILDMIKLCKAAGVPAPQFRQDGGQFIQTLRRPSAEATAQITAKVKGEVTAPVRRILGLLENRGELGNTEILSIFELKNRRRMRENYLAPALRESLIEYTIPDKPNGSLQKYRLTDKGRAWIAGRKP